MPDTHLAPEDTDAYSGRSLPHQDVASPRCSSGTWDVHLYQQPEVPTARRLHHPMADNTHLQWVVVYNPCLSVSLSV